MFASLIEEIRVEAKKRQLDGADDYPHHTPKGRHKMASHVGAGAGMAASGRQKSDLG